MSADIVVIRNLHDLLPEAVHLIETGGTTVDDIRFRTSSPMVVHCKEPRERVVFRPVSCANPFETFQIGLIFMNSAKQRLEQLVHGLINQPTAVHTFRFEELTIHFTITDQKTLNAIASHPVYHITSDIMPPICTMVQEAVAAFVGVPVGQYWHVMPKIAATFPDIEKLYPLSNDRRTENWPVSPYESDSTLRPFPMVAGGTQMVEWMQDLHMCVTEGRKAIGYRDGFFRRTALPMQGSFMAFHEENYDTATSLAQEIKATDWKKAALDWIKRK